MKRTKAQIAMEHIWAAILTRQLSLVPHADGFYPMTVSILCDQLGLTTASARDGLHLLAMTGRVTYQPHLGYQLAPLSKQDWHRLSIGLNGLIGACVDRLPARIDEQTALTLLGLIHSIQHLPAKDYCDKAILAHWHQQLHHTLCSGINPYLDEAIQPIIAHHVRYLTHPDIALDIAQSWQNLLPTLRGLVSARPQAHTQAYQAYWQELNSQIEDRIGKLTSGQFL
ncbi:hypothetical protein [Salinivibrio sp. ES.052]|uniref:hypothetical protein n=1 Tax=Salinivibrio sp. ES.052 TaxID=1882823 RepID=UPI00092A1FCD|nr:hypothetical protein [Salinivibrio sp. ES.052]SIO27743.1 hypothetical protein SAMN05444724_2583 [Salinivibrio sp. ES.052]